ncbi:glycosyltransferase [bacterium]|nr:glycosyltransferase [bacterium]
MLSFPKITVAICSRNRPRELEECLASLQPIRSKAHEIIVVDNGSDGDATKKVAEKYKTVYIHEPTIGLSTARNSAIRSASGEIIAFIDDDCQVDPGWLDAIARAFGDRRIGAVTGKAISGDQSNWVQRQFNSFARGFCAAESVEMTPEKVGNIYIKAVLGVGANMAFRRELLVALKGFSTFFQDCSDDDYLQCRVIRAGYHVRYAPDSIVFQKHRTGMLSTLHRLFEYGVGDTRLLWYFSAQDQSFKKFLYNFIWTLVHSELRTLFQSIIHFRGWHVLFSLASIAGYLSGLLLPWGWSAHLCGKFPDRPDLTGPNSREEIPES